MIDFVHHEVIERKTSKLGSLDSRESARHKQHLDWFSRFAGLTHVSNTETDTRTTECATSVAIRHINAMHAIRPKTVLNSQVKFSELKQLNIHNICRFIRPLSQPSRNV